MQELDEEEYDALPEKEKEHLMERYRVKLRQIKLRYKLEVADKNVPSFLFCSPPVRFIVVTIKSHL